MSNKWAKIASNLILDGAYINLRHIYDIKAKIFEHILFRNIFKTTFGTKDTLKNIIQLFSSIKDIINQQ